jgi:hypothetical protein
VARLLHIRAYSRPCRDAPRSGAILLLLRSLASRVRCAICPHSEKEPAGRQAPEGVTDALKQLVVPTRNFGRGSRSPISRYAKENADKSVSCASASRNAAPELEISTLEVAPWPALPLGGASDSRTTTLGGGRIFVLIASRIRRGEVLALAPGPAPLCWIDRARGRILWLRHGRPNFGSRDLMCASHVNAPS